MLDTNLFQQRMEEWHQHNFPNSPGEFVLLKAGEELGELNRAHVNARTGVKGTPEQWEIKAKDAVGDCVLALMAYCNKQGFKFEDCVEIAWKELQSRDFRRFPLNGKTE